MASEARPGTSTISAQPGQSSPPAAQPPATKIVKPRVRTNATQVAILTASFALCEHANSAELERLEKDTGLLQHATVQWQMIAQQARPKKFISGWFGRQRQKKRNQLKQEATSAAAPPAMKSSARPEVLLTDNPNIGLKVKKEACEAAMAPRDAGAPATGRKRQRARKPNAPDNKKKRKVVVVPVEKPNITATGTQTPALCAAPDVTQAPPPDVNKSTSTGPGTGDGRVSSLFDKIQVKMERYTPPPSELLSSNSSNRAASSGMDPGQATQQPGIIRSRSALAEAMNPEVSGERRRAIPNTAVSKKKGASRAQAQAIAPRLESKTAQVPPRSKTVKTAAMPLRVSSPSDVAIKSRRQRDTYAGEGPILRTQWKNHGVDSFRGQAQDSSVPGAFHSNDDLTATNFDYRTTQAYSVPSKSIQQPPPQTLSVPVHFSAPLYSPGPMVYPRTQASNATLTAPTPPPGHALYPTRREVSYAAPTEVKPAHPHPLPAIYQNLLRPSSSYTLPLSNHHGLAPAYPNGMQASSASLSSTSLDLPTPPPSYTFESPTTNVYQAVQYSRQETPGTTPSSGWPSPQLYTAAEYCAETDWLRGFKEHLENAPHTEDYVTYLSPLREAPQGARPILNQPPQLLDHLDAGTEYPLNAFDPLHAPLKHLTDIVSPLCDSLGISYDKLATLDGEQKHEVMEKLLDEEMGERDPFRAAMGLVMASKLGLKWN